MTEQTITDPPKMPKRKRVYFCLDLPALATERMKTHPEEFVTLTAVVRWIPSDGFFCQEMCKYFDDFNLWKQQVYAKAGESVPDGTWQNPGAAER